jgi:hypothetical protein
MKALAPTNKKIMTKVIVVEKKVKIKGHGTK